MTNDSEHNVGKITKNIFYIATAAFLWSLLLMWTWNTVAMEVFDLPKVQFKHTFLVAINLVVLLFFRTVSSRNRRHFKS